MKRGMEPREEVRIAGTEEDVFFPNLEVKLVVPTFPGPVGLGSLGMRSEMSGRTDYQESKRHAN